MGGKKRKTTDIPLDAIPRKRKGEGSGYTDEFRRKAVDMMRSQSVKVVAGAIHVSVPTLMLWQRQLDPLADLRVELDQEQRVRVARLERAALAVEVEGTRGRQLAAAIRALGTGAPGSTADRRRAAQREVPHKGRKA